MILGYGLVMRSPSRDSRQLDCSLACNRGPHSGLHMHRTRGEQGILAGPRLIHSVSYGVSINVPTTYYPIGLVNIVAVLNALNEVMLNRLNKYYFVQCL